MSSQPPKPLGDPVKHYWLATSMAKAAGVDLVAAHRDGVLDQEDWSAMVTRCRDCDWERGGACTRWLPLQEPGEAEVPAVCENVEKFADILKRTR